MRPKLATLSVLEWIAGLARRLGLGFLVDRLAPLVGAAVRALRARRRRRPARAAPSSRTCTTSASCMEHGREQTFVRLLTEAMPPGGVVLEGGAHLGFVTVHAAQAAGPNGRVIAFEPNADRARRAPREPGRERRRRTRRGRPEGARRQRRPDALLRQRRRRDEQPLRAGRWRPCRSRWRSCVPTRRLPGPSTWSSSTSRAASSRRCAGWRACSTRLRPPRALFLECNPELLERAGHDRARSCSPGSRPTAIDVEWIDEARGRTAPLSEPWTEAYVNLRCTRAREAGRLLRAGPRRARPAAAAAARPRARRRLRRGRHRRAACARPARPGSRASRSSRTPRPRRPRVYDEVRDGPGRGRARRARRARSTRSCSTTCSSTSSTRGSCCGGCTASPRPERGCTSRSRTPATGRCCATSRCAGRSATRRPSTATSRTCAGSRGATSSSCSSRRAGRSTASTSARCGRSRALAARLTRNLSPEFLAYQLSALAHRR